MVRIAINGFGRIGRNILRAYLEAPASSAWRQNIEIVAINDLSAPEVLGHLLKFDSAHGELRECIEVKGDQLCAGTFQIKLLSESNPENLPWQDLSVDVVLECTGFFTTREGAEKHLQAGAQKVLISAPGKNVDATVVYGVNDSVLSENDVIVSNASCTTNCLAPIAKVIHESFGIEEGLVNTVHAYTNDQRLLDLAHSDLRRARAAAHSIIPSKTGAAAAIGLVIPELDGKLNGMSLRVPVLNVSVVDLTVTLQQGASIEQVNEAFVEAEKLSPGVLKTNSLPLVSKDFNHNSASSIVDLTQTMLVGNTLKVLSWYDNEWGFSNRMIDTVLAMDSQNHHAIDGIKKAV